MHTKLKTVCNQLSAHNLTVLACEASGGVFDSVTYIPKKERLFRYSKLIRLLSMLVNVEAFKCLAYLCYLLDMSDRT